MKVSFSFILMSVVLVLAACSGAQTPGTTTPAPTRRARPSPTIPVTASTASGSPDAAAMELFQAIADQDGLKVDDLTCNALKAQSQQSGTFAMALSILGQSIVGTTPKIDVSHLEFKTEKTEGATADVRVSGQLRAAVGLSVDSKQMDELLRMVNEDNVWKYCGQGSSGEFAEADLPRLVLQPFEFPTSRTDLDRYLNKVTSYEIEYSNALSGYERSFPMECAGCWYYSAVFLFENDNQAATGLSTIAGLQVQDLKNNNQKVIEAKDLGEEAVAYMWSDVSVDHLDRIAYFWRTKNIVFSLRVQAKPGSVLPASVRAFANQIQSHAQGAVLAPNTSAPKADQSDLHNLGFIVASGYNPEKQDSSSGIYRMRPDGTELKQLTFEGINNVPLWSPDGTKIWFQSNRDGQWQIYTMEPDGSNQTNFAPNSLNTGFQGWSPDRTQIVYTVGEEIWIANLNGSGKRKLAPKGNFPEWFPDGKHLSYQINNTSWAVDIESGETHQTAKVEGEFFPGYSLSPDGKHLLYLVKSGSNAGTWAVPTDGSSKKVLLTKLLAWFPKWTPDARKIAFATERSEYESEIWIVNSDGKEQVKVADTNDAAYRAKYGWSKDGQSFCYIGIGNIFRIAEESSNSGIIQWPELVRCLGFGRKSPAGNWLVYGPPLGIALDKSPKQLFVQNSDGSEVLQITSGNLSWDDPDWQP